MKGLDLSKFKKVSSDKHSTVMQHPDGHQITIAHSKLKGALKKQLEELPAMSEGGEVDDSTNYTNRPDKGFGKIIFKAEGGEIKDPSFAPSLADQWANMPDAEKNPVKQPHNYTAADMQEIGKVGSQIATGVAKDIGAEHMLPEAQAQTMPSNDSLMPSSNVGAGTAGSMLPTQPGGTDMMGNLNALAGGMQKQAQVEGDLGKQKADLAQQQQLSMQRSHDAFVKDSQSIMQDFNHLVDDAKNSRIDPNRFWNSKSDLGKVSSAIGLILGGIGGGMTHQENPALKFLNAQIDRDVDAQRANIANKNNIMHALQQQYGNIKDASNMTKAFYADMYSSKLEEAAAKSADPMAKARAQQAIAQLKLQYGPVVQQTMMRQAMMQGSANGTMPPEKLVPHLVPQEHQEAVFKEIQRAQNTAHSRKAVLEAFDKAASQYKVPGMPDRSGVKAFHANMGPTFADIEGTVRQAAMDTAFANMTPQSGDSDATVASKRKTVIDYMDSKEATPRANAYGIKIPKPNSFKPR